MKGIKEITFRFQMDLKAVIDDESPGKDDESTIHYIKQMVTKFLKYPKARLSFYLESFLGLFAGSSIYDTIKQAFEIKEDEKEHFLPIVQECDEDARDFILELFKPDKQLRIDQETLILDMESDNNEKYEGLDLLYAKFSPFKITGLCFWEESPDGILIESKLMPNGKWRRKKSSNQTLKGITKE